VSLSGAIGPHQAESRLVDAGPARIAVRIAGRGPLVVCLPGLGRDSSDLDPFAALLIEAGFRVALPQPRGMEGSSGPLDGITLHDLAADIAAVIEALGGAPALLVGHAFGNRVARMLAADRGALVRLVVLLGASGKVQPSPEIAEAIRLAQAEDTPPDMRARAVQAAWFAPGADITPWLSGWSQKVMKAYLAAAAATPIEAFWTAGEAPMLIVQGLCDLSAPVENGHLLQQQVGDRATLIDMPDIGHALPVEDPRRVAAVVLPALRRHASQETPHADR
jgi:pimeloyl-ACP methyl ester carboxylesterase